MQMLKFFLDSKGRKKEECGRSVIGEREDGDGESEKLNPIFCLEEK